MSEDPAAVIADLDGRASRLWSSSGGVRMIWRRWGAGPRIVLLHGGAGSWMHWLRNIPVLAETYEVWAPDTPGLGGSDPAPEGATSDEIAAIVGAGLDEVVGEDARYHLAGFSFGGVLAAQLAARHGVRLLSLTLVGSGGMGGPRPEQRLVKVRNKTGVEREEAHRANLAHWMIADPARIDALAMAIQAWNSDHTRLNSTGFHADGPVPRALEKVHVPLFGIWGEHDASAGQYMALREGFLRAVRPDIDYRVIAGAGHWVAFEQPQIFNEMLKGMLSKPG